jgi:hypothetical protein
MVFTLLDFDTQSQFNIFAMAGFFTLQRFLGHKRLDMVNHYLNLSSTDIQNAHKKANTVDRRNL